MEVSQAQNGKLEDKYYKRLPECLKENGITKQGWLVLFDPHSKPGSERRPMINAIPKSCLNNNVFFLQNYLSVFDLLKESLRIRPYFKFLSFKKRIHTVLHGEGFNLYPLFRKELHYRFFDSSLVHLRLIELAVRRACSELSPKVTLNFLKPIYFPEPVIAVQGKLTRIQFVSQCNMLLIMKNQFALDAILPRSLQLAWIKKLCQRQITTL